MILTLDILQDNVYVYIYFYNFNNFMLAFSVLMQSDAIN